MIIPAGKTKKQIAQGSFKHESFYDSDLFSKIAETGTNILDGPARTSPKPQVDPMLQQTMNSGLDSRIPPAKPAAGTDNLGDVDLGIAGQNSNSITPSGHQPIKAQPTGALPEDQQDPSQQSDFWSQLANAITPFLKERFLRIMGSPKLTDRENGTYELLLGPKIDPRTGQPMQLPDADPNQLYADANQIAQAAKGRVNGLPWIDEHSVWHIPLQIGGGKKKLVSKGK